MKKYLVSFYGEGLKGTNSFWKERQDNLNAVALKSGGIDEVISWNMEKLKKTLFYEHNKHILDADKGAGVWAWKSWIIFDTLSKIEDDDVVIYYDVGSKGGNSFEINTNINPLIDWVIKNNNGVLTGFYRPDTINKDYTKRDCFVYMNCDIDKYRDHPQIGATYSIWQKNELTMNIITEWMTYSRDERIITEQPNVCGLPSFGKKLHRHDQSIMTNLTIKYNLKCYPITVGSGKNLSCLIRMVEIDNFCMKHFGVKFGMDILNEPTLNKDIADEIVKMLIFIKTDNPLHSFHKTPAFLMQSVFENNKYISFFNIQINDFIDQIKTKSW